MALISCKECGREISSQAAACPGCGAPIGIALVTEKKQNFEVALLLIPFVATLLIWFWVGSMNLLQSPDSTLTLIGFSVVFSTAVLVGLEAKSLGMGTDENKFGTGPMGWFFGMLLLWIVVYPVYLFRRKTFGAKNQLPLELIAGMVFAVSWALMSYGIEQKKEDIRSRLQQLSAQLEDVKTVPSQPAVKAIAGPAAAPQISFTQEIQQPPKHKNITLAWQTPVTLSGNFGTGMFDNCCSDGQANRQQYYFIHLANKVDVVDTSQQGAAQQGDTEKSDTVVDVDVIQLGISETELPPGLASGVSITVTCKELWEGMTGHYALPVYCNEARIAPALSTAGGPVADVSVMTEQRVLPSFDCSKAKGTVEELICADPELSRLDSELSKIYRIAKTRAVDQNAFKQQAVMEWKWREANCRDKDCIVAWYVRRKSQLQ